MRTSLANSSLTPFAATRVILNRGFLDDGVGNIGSDGERVFWRRWSSLRAERGCALVHHAFPGVGGDMSELPV